MIDNTVDIKGYLYQGTYAYIDTNDLKVDKSKWLVIDGDAYFENIGDKTMRNSGKHISNWQCIMKGILLLIQPCMY